MSKYRVLSTRVEVKRTKYRKVQRYENGRSTEKVELVIKNLVYSRLHIIKLLKANEKLIVILVQTAMSVKLEFSGNI